MFSHCRVKLDSTKKQLMAEAIGSEKKGGNDSVHWKLVGSMYLEITESGGRFLKKESQRLGRQRFYCNDDDRFLNPTILVEKPLMQMKKAEKLTRSQRSFSH